ncbi:MAG: 50S ribosomal protein L31e [Candidatus Woesearchaeota archaeon]
MAIVEREYVIPLRRAILRVPRHQKAKKAITEVRTFLIRHMKTKEVRIGQELNMFLWHQGIKNPPTKVKIKVIKDGDIAKAELFGFEYKEAIKPTEKKEVRGLAGKIQEKLGVKDEPEPKVEEKKEEKKVKQEEKAEPEKPVPVTKKAVKKKAVKKTAKKA